MGAAGPRSHSVATIHARRPWDLRVDIAIEALVSIRATQPDRGTVVRGLMAIRRVPPTR